MYYRHTLTDHVYIYVQVVEDRNSAIYCVEQLSWGDRCLISLLVANIK